MSSAGGAKKPQVLCTAKKASQCATLIIHAYADGGPPRAAPAIPPDPEGQVNALSITRLALDGKVLGSLETYTPETVHVVPGLYEAQVMEGPRTWSSPKNLAVSAGQTRRVTFEVGP